MCQIFPFSAPQNAHARRSPLIRLLSKVDHLATANFVYEHQVAVEIALNFRREDRGSVTVCPIYGYHLTKMPIV